MRASAAHISVRQPHLAAEFSRNLRYNGPPATIVRAPAVATGAISADDQLYAIREDPSLGDRGVPIIGAGPGAIRFTRPTDCLDRVAQLQLLWLRAAATG